MFTLTYSNTQIPDHCLICYSTPNITRFPSYFWIAIPGPVIHPSLMHICFLHSSYRLGLKDTFRRVGNGYLYYSIIEKGRCICGKGTVFLWGAVLGAVFGCWFLGAVFPKTTSKQPLILTKLCIKPMKTLYENLGGWLL